MEVIETSEEQFYCSDDAPNERKDEPKAPCIDDFEFIKPISKGAFGKVFLGHKRGKPDQLYAIKAMKKSHMINKNLTHQVVTERDAMAKLMSPFVVQLYYSFQSQQNIFLVMEYLIGGDMKSLLNVAGFFDPPMALMYVAEVTLALEYLHSKKIIHRDIKPDNMLITATGHLKLTDFGLSKCNMAFNSMDVPMTPKTPMPYSQKLDMYRTPGQVLSLRSSLAFSTEKNQPLDGSTPHSHDGHIISPLTDISNISSDRRSIGHVTPVGVKLNKQKSMRDLLLSQSTSKYMNQSGSRTFRGVTTPGRPGTSPKPPIKRLTSTLQESLNWTKSTNSQVEPSHVSDMTSPVNTDPTCSMSLTDSPDPLRADSVMSISHASNDCDGTSDYLSDDVFLSMNSTNNQNSGHLADHSDITGTHSNLCDTCQCKKQKTADTSCNECCSHLKAPSRQEKMTDDTPQMHRSNESVWNSYAAKNLRSLRHGSYSEDNDEDVDSDSKDGLGDVFSHNSPQRPNMPDIFQARSDLKPKSIRARPRRLMKTKSFCYPSDDESDAEDRHREVMKMGKKRNFSHVEQSPIRRTHSADSGLTQEIRLLGMEPCAKRSNSVPRTRIRFHSGNDSRKTDKSLPLQPNRLKDCTESLSKIIYKCKSISDMDKMLLLSADEHRLVEGHSDTSLTSESDCKGHTTKGQGSNCTNVSGTCLVSPDTLSGSHIVEQRKDSYCSGHNTSLKLQPENEVVLTGAPEMVGPMNKRIMGMKQKMVSSVQSESDLHTHIDTNVSSIYDSDGNRSLPTYIGESVAKSKSSPSPSKAVVVPSTPNPKPAALLPPPPPKTRHPSGKTTPARLRFCSTTTSIPPSAHFHSHDYSGYADVCATPEPSRRGMFFTPGVTIPKTPKTPHQKMLVRSQSFCHAMKTPYRTPKLDRRAPVQEEERILGTPDYLAPEILQQKPHGPEVDWWALGVCMFEFLTGVPPFNDQTPDLVFKNILERDIPWPEGDEALLEECQEAIEALLTVDPKHRPGARAVRKMAAFKEIDWHNILDVTPPFIPQPDSMTDTAYFEARNMMQGLFVSDVDLH